ncbi:arylesterase [Psychrobacter sp. M13]|uniref:arylesterase n=1 Tax=Psychrobacter sp. M13 TaxID=3067275 RepID=UPI00273BE566|nr:arylesterase [Psychrobacter sp. M13]WLP94497.1 arylesterase [Psychrobacter sp. M13]
MINRSCNSVQSNKKKSLVWRPLSYLTVAVLSSVVALSGCQKTPETDVVADPTTETQTSEPATVTAPVAQSNDSDNADVNASGLTEQGMLAPVTVLALGDSLTEGLGVANDDNYPAQLQASLQNMGYKNIEVVNSGLSGETSTGLVNRIDWVLQTKPDITILTIGANDAIRGLDIATIEANIRTAVKKLQDNGSEVILGGMQIYDNLGNDYVKSFSAIYPRVAEDMNVPLIPFFLKGVGGDANLNQADAIHPTREGYTIIVNDNILPVLKPELEQMLLSTQANSQASVATSATENVQ